MKTSRPSFLFPRPFIVIIVMLLSAAMYAQAPEGVNYQAVVRNPTGAIISNHRSVLS